MRLRPCFPPARNAVMRVTMNLCLRTRHRRVNQRLLRFSRTRQYVPLTLRNRLSIQCHMKKSQKYPPMGSRTRLEADCTHEVPPSLLIAPTRIPIEIPQPITPDSQKYRFFPLTRTRAHRSICGLVMAFFPPRCSAHGLASLPDLGIPSVPPSLSIRYPRG